MSGLKVLMAGSIDYAGLFPPAALEMPEAIRNYAAYLESGDAWALGRFVVPVARLHEVADQAWPLSLVARFDETVPAEVAEVVEIKAASLQQLESAAAQLPDGMRAYFESPVELVGAIARLGHGAKIRMGGESVPDSTAVARFISVCVGAQIRFKATAGLHHAIRSSEMHGFLNVMMASCLAWDGASEHMICDVLEERDPRAFQFDGSGAEWNGWPLKRFDVGDAREALISGFGSCSFEEPLAELKALGYPL